MINCLNINLDINPLREGVIINSYGTTEYTKLNLNDINHDLISFLSTLNLTISWAVIFYTAPFDFTRIHDDADYITNGNDYIKLNYVFGGHNSVMCWWKQKDNVSNTSSNTVGDFGEYYKSFKLHQVDLIDEQQVKFPSIVQVGIPHNIKNFEEPRYCLSLVLRKQDKTRLTMAESVELFKQYLQQTFTSQRLSSAITECNIRTHV
jgi:hypothetical protein